MTKVLSQDDYLSRRADLIRQLAVAEATSARVALQAELDDADPDALKAARDAVDEIKQRMGGLEAARALSARIEDADRAAAHLIARAAAGAQMRQLQDEIGAQASNVQADFNVFAASWAKLMALEDRMWPIASPFVAGPIEGVGSIARGFNERRETVFVAGMLYRAGFDRMDEHNWTSARRMVDGMTFEEFVRQQIDHALRMAQRHIPEIAPPAADDE